MKMAGFVVTFVIFPVVTICTFSLVQDIFSKSVGQEDQQRPPVNRKSDSKRIVSSKPNLEKWAVDIMALENLAFLDLAMAKIIAENLNVKNFPSHHDHKQSNIKAYKMLLHQFKKYLSDVEGSLPIQFQKGQSHKLKNSVTDILDSGFEINLGCEKWRKEQAQQVSQNPVAAFRLIHRFYILLPKLKNLLAKVQNTKDSTFELDWTQGFLDLIPDHPPNQSDYLSVIGGLLRLVEIHFTRMTTLTVANGTFFGVPLEADHCFELGLFVHRHYSDTLLAIQWLAIGLVKRAKEKPRLDIPQDENSENSEMAELLLNLVKKQSKALSSVNKELGDLHSPEQLLLAPSTLDTLISTSLELYLSGQQKGKDDLIKNSLSIATQKSLEFNQTLFFLNNTLYLPLCGGDNFQTDLEKSRLFCWYEKVIHPFYRIGPMKMELLSMDPDIVQIYEVVGPKTIQQIEEESRGQFVRGSYTPPSTDDNDDDDESGGKNKTKGQQQQKDLIKRGRFHKIAMDNYRFEKGPLPRKIEDCPQVRELLPILRHGRDLFGVNFRELKLGTYSFVGWYQPHFDILGLKETLKPENSVSMRNRVATFQVYLSDDPEGGETVFPLARIAVKPVKGSAILWFNMMMDGTVELKSMHGSCPVVHGRKFIMVNFAWISSCTLPTYFCPRVHTPRFRASVNGQWANEFIK